MPMAAPIQRTWDWTRYQQICIQTYAANAYIIIDTWNNGECVWTAPIFSGWWGLEWPTIKGHIEMPQNKARGWKWEKGLLGPL